MAERLNLARAIARLARRWELDIVEMPDWKGEGAFVAPLLPAHCLPIVRLHGTASALAAIRGGKASFLTEFFEIKALAGASHKIAVSRFIDRATRLALRGLKPSDVVLPNFVDTELFAPGDEATRDPRLVAYAGRVSLAKGLDLLIDSARELFQKHPDARLHIAGLDVHEAQGMRPLRHQLMEKIPPEDAARIRFLGPLPRNELIQLYRRASCLVMPARAEAFGIVALEAMACGCLPVVVSGSGPAEFVRNGETGFVASTQSPRSIAEQVAAVFEVGDGKALRAAARRQVVGSFSPDVVIEKNLRFYEHIVQNARKPREAES
jgi:glycosyltransferase involved in cell wall biosynthesis